MELPQRIAQCRKRLGMSQELLAQKMQVSRQAVTKWESGQSAPSAANLERLARLFGVSPAWLLSGEADADNPVRKRAQSGRSRVREKARQRLLDGIRIASVYLLLFLAGRLLLGAEGDRSLLGLLSGTDSVSYLFGWMLTSGLYWAIAALSLAGALIGKRRFAWAVLAGAAAGFLLGEGFGAYPPGEPFGQGDYGWAILLGNVFVFALGGAVLERLARLEKGIFSKSGRITLGAMVAGSLAVLLLVRASMPRVPF